MVINFISKMHKLIIYKFFFDLKQKLERKAHKKTEKNKYIIRVNLSTFTRKFEK